MTEPEFFLLYQCLNHEGVIITQKCFHDDLLLFLSFFFFFFGLSKDFNYICRFFFINIVFVISEYYPIYASQIQATFLSDLQN